MQADFDTSVQCRMEALQCVVGSTAIVAYTQAFWTYRALGDPLPVDIRDQLLKPAGVRGKLRLDVRKNISYFTWPQQHQTHEAVNDNPSAFGTRVVLLQAFFVHTLYQGLCLMEPTA